jgi:hypothetical protein
MALAALDVRAASEIELHHDGIIALLPVIVDRLQGLCSLELAATDLLRGEVFLGYLLLFAYPGRVLFGCQAAFERAGVDGGSSVRILRLPLPRM